MLNCSGIPVLRQCEFLKHVNWRVLNRTAFSMGYRVE